MKNNSSKNITHKQTTIRKKIQIIFTIFFTCCITVTFLVVTNFIQKTFGELEKKDAANKLFIFSNVYYDKVDVYVSYVRDYAAWDETYSFVQNRNSSYVDENLPLRVFSDLQINLILVVNNLGETIYANMVDYSNETEIGGYSDAVDKLSKLNVLSNTDPEYSFQGIILMPDGPMLICSYPVLPNEGDAPVAGNMFFGRYIDDAMLLELSQYIGLNVSAKVIPKDHLEQIHQTNAAVSEISNESIITNEKNVEASLLILDAFSESAISFVIQIPRELSQVGTTTLNALLWGLTVFSVIVFSLLLICLYNIVISRITRLQHDVIAITDSKDVAKRVCISRGNDEISYLSNHINNMLNVTEDLYSNIKQANENLDLKVKERTKELLVANEALEVEKAKIQHLAYHDTLTGLPNDLYFKEFLNREILALSRMEKPLAVLFLDLDGFKMINDTLGHPAGDRLLIDVSNRLSSILRKCDTLARIGGDEFLVMINTVKEVDSLDLIASKILKGLAQPFSVDDQECFISVSIGIAISPIDGGTGEELIKNADLAMYKAKEMGRNQFCYCNQQMKNQVMENMVLSNHLWRGLERNEFELYYQPQINNVTNEIVGAEALIRWNHPERGMIMPGSFISLAEQTGAIIPIGEWVLKTAAKQCKIWQDMCCPDLRMAVNVSVKQLQNREIINQVKNVLKTTGLSPGKLELEITENVIMRETNYVVGILNALKDMGIEIAIDDFGTEYASMSYLKHLPVDRIKIAMPFIQGIDLNEKDQAITKSLIVLAKSMGMAVIAEGVETKSQLDFLTQRMCDETQGYYFYKPMPVNKMEEILKLQAKNSSL